MNVKFLIKMALVASIYVVLTIWNPLSYSEIQFRISEVLVLLCFFRKEYIYALTIGCIIANIFSPLGIIDIVLGSLATFISCLFIIISRNLFVASLFPVIFNALIVGFELNFVLHLPLITTIISVALGEFAVVSVIGVLLFRKLGQNKGFLELIEAKERVEKDI
ncbi:MAG: QueT transporter family protein [Bacilli bacterium]